MWRTVMASTAAIAGMFPVHVYAQPTRELSMYNRGHFKGARVDVVAPLQSIEPPITVRSVVVPPGTRWELCSGNTFSGCREYGESDPSMVMTVRSVRPLAPALSSAPSGAGVAPVTGQSLRGWASEFFVAPDEGGQRVEVRPGTGEAMTERARAFCRSRGWRSSAYQRLQTVGQTSYLADVLCVDVGG